MYGMCGKGAVRKIFNGPFKYFEEIQRLVQKQTLTCLFAVYIVSRFCILFGVALIMYTDVI
jgi:hypothetical protein